LVLGLDFFQFLVIAALNDEAADNPAEKGLGIVPCIDISQKVVNYYRSIG
jgi:hypothetical protein